MNHYLLLADLLLYLHFGFVLFVIGGFLLIWIGFFLKWGWVRNRIFRILHLLAMGLVTVQALGSIPCPLTVWERDLRIAAGEEAYEGSFMDYWVNRLLFHDWSDLTFVLIYVVFFLVIAASWVVVRPGRRMPPAREVGE